MRCARLVCIARLDSEKELVSPEFYSAAAESPRWVTRWGPPGWQRALLDGKRRISPSRCWSPVPARTTPHLAQRFFWQQLPSVAHCFFPTLSSTTPYNYIILYARREMYMNPGKWAEQRVTAKVNGHSVPDGWPQEGSLSFTSHERQETYNNR